MPDMQSQYHNLDKRLSLIELKIQTVEDLKDSIEDVSKVAQDLKMATNKRFDFSVFDGALWRLDERLIEEGEACDVSDTPLGLLIAEHLNYHFRDKNLGPRHTKDITSIQIENRQTAVVYDTWKLSLKVQQWCEDFNFERPVFPFFLRVKLNESCLEICGDEE